MSLLLLLTLGTTTVWGQNTPVGTDYTGYYFIANYGGYNANNKQNNYYLIPSIKDYIDASSQQPFLTTYQSYNYNSYDHPSPGYTNLNNGCPEDHSLWEIIFAGNYNDTDYWYLKHVSSSMYLCFNEFVYKDNKDRARVHLESKPENSSDNKWLFSITQGAYNATNILAIIPKGETKSLNPAKDSKPEPFGINSGNPGWYTSANGEKVYFAGIVGYYQTSSGDTKYTGSHWIFETPVCETPVIEYEGDDKIRISTTTPGATIYYTTDETDPSDDTNANRQTGSGISFTIDVTNNLSVVRVCVEKSHYTSSSSTFDLTPETPVITYDVSTNKVSITCATPGASIYFTTDGMTPTINSSEFSSAFTLDNTITIVRAIAKKGGATSSVNNKAFVKPGSENAFLFQSVDNTYFYMVAGDNNNNSKPTVNTSSLPQAGMSWSFEDAGNVNGVQCYYVKNTSANGYLRRDGNNFYIESTTTNNNDYKFAVIPYINDNGTIGGFNLYNIGRAQYVYKGNSNDSATGNGSNGAVNLSADGTQVVAQWNLILVANKNFPSPVTLSDNSSATYYTLASSNTPAQLITTPTGTSTYVTTSSGTSDSQKWYFKDAGDDGWASYYYILNAVTGEAMYFGQEAASATIYNALEMGPLPETPTDNYKFALAHTITGGEFYIVPKPLAQYTKTKYTAVWYVNNTTPLQTQPNRADSRIKWQISQVANFLPSPYIIYDIATNTMTISCTTPGATIYYTTDGTEPTTSSPNSISPADANSTAISSFELPAGAKIIRAIAYKENVNTSSETSYSVPIQLTLNDENKRPYLIWNKNNNSNWLDEGNNPKPTFFMIPSDTEDGDITVNTTTMPRPTMEWLFLNAAKDDTQYYTIKNNSSNGYLYYDENKDAGKKIYIKDTYDSSDDGYRFSIVPYYSSNTLQGYNIIPYGLTSGDRFVHKGNNNNAANRVTLNNSQNSANSLWFFAIKSELDQIPPFVKSDNSATHYYKIESAENAGYCVVPPATGQTNVTITNVMADNMNWYLEMAQAETTTDWLTYYYIRNALTGEYIYFTGEAMTNSSPVFEMRGSVDQSTDAEHYRYQFTWTKSPNTDSYYIVPRTYAGESLSNICTLYRDGSNLKTNATRANNTRWKFVGSTFTCATPVIAYSETQNGYVITSETPGAKIYYTTGDNSNTLEWTEYTVGTVIPTPTTPTTIKAIATRTADHSDKSGVAEFPVTQVASPVFDYSAGSSVAITCATEGAVIYYVINGTIDSTDPTNGTTLYNNTPLTDDDGIVGKTINAIAVKPGSVSSTVVTSETIVLRCATPVIKRGSDNASFTIECSFPTSGVTIKYTTATGSGTPADPATNGINYPGGGVSCTFPITVSAIAIANGYGYGNSAVATKTLEEGLAEENGIYLISSDVNFETFVDMVNNNENGEAAAHYKLTANVSASGADPITTPFTGIFEAGFDESSDNYGNFYKISGLRHALFNTINGGKVRNVILDDVIINNQNSEVNSGHAGAICNEATGASRIYNCGILPAGIIRHYDEEEDKVIIDGFTGNGSTTGNSVGGSGNVGSIVGQLSGNSRVINCFSYANITGGSIVAGIVGNNATAITQSNVTTASMVVNCMFYGDITGGSTISPVYGGYLIDNAGTTSVNGYNYFRGNATFDDNFTNIDQYKRTWPADEEYLTRFEYYRSILNSNRQLCTFWVTDKKGSEQTAADTALIAKWVLDPSIAPYPILKKWGKYPSVINRDSERIWDPRIYDKETKTESLTPHWVDRNGGPDYHGKKLGILKVTINPGGHAATGVSTKSNIDYIITDMDTLNCDYGYAKIQLPYYNEVFGDPTVQIIGPTAEDKANQWNERYGGNYTDYVVTGWDITSVTGGTPGTFKEAWEDGYNFADRGCTEKDKHRTFAQGGYYYVPENVTSITITAHWGQAVYLRNADNSVDRVNVTNGGSHGSAFTPAGTLSNPYNWTTVKNTFASAIVALGESTASAPLTVYDQAVVLVGNYQKRNGNDAVGKNVNDGKWHPFTIMSADFDMDNEPDYCMQWQFRSGTGRPGIQPIRFDFLPVVELGLAIRHNNLGYAIGVFIPQGHFEITETAYMHTTQFEYDADIERIETESPLILNGGNFEQIVVRYGNKNRTSYILMGGNFRIKRFTPGYHATASDIPVRHCAVNAIGGEYPEFYLSGIYRPDFSVNSDNPHCYTNGGYFGLMAGAGYEQVDGDITFKIDHSIIGEFYGGGINAAKSVTGKVDVTIDHSLVTKYCGGPKVGILGTVSGTTANYKTVTTHATGTTFGVFYGGGNGGTSYYRDQQHDNTGSFPAQTADAWTFDSGKKGFNKFFPLNDGGGTYNDQKGYHAEFEFEIFKSSNGLVTTEDVIRAYINWAQFGTTTTGNVTNTLTDCIVKGDFFGGGNLANVIGNVESTLTGNTQIYGSVYGAGFSASIPSFRVHDKSRVTFPQQDFTGTIIEQGSLSYIQDNGIDRYYTWSNEQPEGKGVSTSNPTFQDDNGKWYCYTKVPLANLGTVTGNATLSIEGNTKVGSYATDGSLKPKTGNVYGGGAESAVKKKEGVADSGNTIVNLQGNAQIYGNVFGGGDQGVVEGSTEVNIEE